jgi:hypothetical protein
MPNRVPEAGTQTTLATPQLSEAFTSNDAAASHSPGPLLVTMFGGHVRRGASMSSIITRNTQLDSLPLGSRAVQVTAFVPLGKELPDGGTQDAGSTPQLSAAVAEKIATAPQRPGAALSVMSGGQEIAGLSASSTSTKKTHSCTLPDMSSAMQYTTFSPTGKGDPLGGSQNDSAPSQLSVTEAA